MATELPGSSATTEAPEQPGAAPEAAAGADGEAATGPRRGRGRRVLRGAAIALVVLVVLGAVSGEIVARFVLGLGNPPLYRPDPQIEYLPVPGVYRRFGNTISYNSHSMRSPEIPATKSDPNELRVMVIGDSVVNGGAPSDDSELATALLPGMLSKQLGRPVVVGNISCGSWGPINQLEYVRRYGLFDADVVVIVVNSDDAFDAPTYGPLGPEHPTKKPVLALQELLFYYGPMAFKYHVLGEKEAGPPPPILEPNPEDQRASLAAFERLVITAREAGARVVAVHHFKLTELRSGRAEPGYDRLREAAGRAGVRFVDTRADMLRLMREKGTGYRDYIHPDAAGQEALARLLAREVVAATKDR